MSIPNTRPLERRPIHPGEILRHEFLPDYGLTVKELADAIGVSRQSVNELLRERRSLSPAMALKLGQLFGNGPEFWLNLQRSVDVYEARRAAPPAAVARAVPKSAGAVRSDDAGAPRHDLASRVLRDPRASAIQKRLAAAAVSLPHLSRGAYEDAQRTAAMVLGSDRYAGVTRQLALALKTSASEGRPRSSG
jgi:antitoxin HigA-1